jgi:hypothetical protein
MADPQYGELEIGLHRWHPDSYSAELRFTPASPDGDVEVKIVERVQFDVEGLSSRSRDPAAYGRLLTENLFHDPEMGEFFALVSGKAPDLRLRLFVGPNVPELHALRWETLRHPRDADASLVTNERLLFARYLAGSGYRSDHEIRLRARSELTALVVIGNPADIARYQPRFPTLAPIDAAGELGRAQTGLGNIPITALVREPPTALANLVVGKPTLDNLVERVREGCDVLYLVCHGAIVEDRPQLWLEDEQGNAARVEGQELMLRLSDLRQLPRLVVLASCQSAGDGVEPGAFELSLGPRLAGGGIPAVLAMQGDITRETVAQFMPAFFQELRRDGLADRATAVARGSVRDRPDSWKPVLFVRPRSARLWYSPGFGEGGEGDDHWPPLLRGISRQECVPILGPGVHEALLGSPREIARHWAEEFGFPLAPSDREELPQVAQFLLVQHKSKFLHDEFQRYIRDSLLERYPDQIPLALRETKEPPLATVVAAIGEHLRAANPVDPHNLIASLDLPLYVTTSPGNLLYEALRARGKEPRVEVGRWNRQTTRLPSVFETDPTFEPSAQQPLIYHVFGTFDQPGSIVLTEDDYFDYLIGLTRNEDLKLAQFIASRLNNSLLLFLGFRMDDWRFRVLFRTIRSQEGVEHQADFSHLAVQFDPEDDRIISPARARRYLERYYTGADVDIYWGGVDDFITELASRIGEDGP